MKRYKWLVIGLAVLFSGIAFVPVMAFPWQEKVDWESFALAYQPQPVIFYVNTTDDAFDANVGDGICKTSMDNCSLRAAITEANLMEDLEAEVIIDLPPGLYTLIFAEFDSHISFWRESSWNVVVRGHGAGNTIIEGNGDLRLFNVYRSATFLDVTLRNGQQSKTRYGGAFDISDYSMLTLINCVVSDNQGSYGGAIYVGYYESFLILESTTLKNNSADYGGAIFNGGGIVYIRNSTISNNLAQYGGGINNNYEGAAIIENSTISGNQAIEGGGIYQENLSYGFLYNSTVSTNSASGQNAGGIGLFNSSAGSVLLNNSVIAGNQSSNSPDCYFGNPEPGNGFYSNGNNLLGSLTGCVISLLGSDVVDSSPGLGPLQDNGGPTETHALLQGSPAINGGNQYGCLDFNNDPITTDQRGYARPGYVGDTRCDIGAYEWDGTWRVYLPLIMR